MFNQPTSTPTLGLNISSPDIRPGSLKVFQCILSHFKMYPSGIWYFCIVYNIIVAPCPLDGCCGEWENWDPVNRFNHTSWMTVVTSTDCPKSVRNRCVIAVFVRFCVVTFFIFCWCMGFSHRTESDIFFFLLGF